jgi:hypothetical protein
LLNCRERFKQWLKQLEIEGRLRVTEIASPLKPILIVVIAQPSQSMDEQRRLPSEGKYDGQTFHMSTRAFPIAA